MPGNKEKKRLLIFSSSKSSFMFTLTMMLSQFSDNYDFDVAFVLPLAGERPKISDYLREHWDAIIIDARPGQEGITHLFYHELSDVQRSRVLVNGHPNNGQFALAIWQHPIIQMTDFLSVACSLDAMFNG